MIREKQRELFRRRRLTPNQGKLSSVSGGGAASANHAVSVSMAFYRPQRNESEEAMATLAVSVAAL